MLLKLTGKFVYKYNNVLLILSTATTLTCSQSTILEFPCRRMVQVFHLKNLLCLGTNFYTNYCCFLVCIWDMQLKRVCVENCRKLLDCWQVNVVLFTQALTWWLCFFSGLITRTGNTRYDHSFLRFELIYQNINSHLLLLYFFCRNTMVHQLWFTLCDHVLKSHAHSVL